MWSALRSCLSVYFDLSPRGMAFLPVIELSDTLNRAIEPEFPSARLAFSNLARVAAVEHLGDHPILDPGIGHVAEEDDQVVPRIVDLGKAGDEDDDGADL